MNIDEAIEILNNTKQEIKTWLGYRDKNTKKKVIEENTKKWKAIETIINEYNNLKQIEEAHRTENGKLRKIEKYVRGNKWSEDYKNSSCRTSILRILEED